MKWLPFSLGELREPAQPQRNGHYSLHEALQEGGHSWLQLMLRPAVPGGRRERNMLTYAWPPQIIRNFLNQGLYIHLFYFWDIEIMRPFSK